MNIKDLDKAKISKNEKAEKIVGLRNLPKNVIPFDQPCELGYHCPVCKYEEPKDDYDERLEWSEYGGFLWCRVCNKDYPSCLCVPDKDKATDIYLDCISQNNQEIVKENDKKWEKWIKEELIEDNLDSSWSCLNPIEMTAINFVKQTQRDLLVKKGEK